MPIKNLYDNDTLDHLVSMSKMGLNEYRELKERVTPCFLIGFSAFAHFFIGILYNRRHDTAKSTLHHYRFMVLFFVFPS